jgi:hypothetical protein
MAPYYHVTRRRTQMTTMRITLRGKSMVRRALGLFILITTLSPDGMARAAM